MNDEQRQELATLLAAHFDGTAGPAEALRLQKLLHDDPAAHAYLAEYCQMHSLLLWEHGGILPAEPGHQAPATPPTPKLAPPPRTGSGWLATRYWRQHRLQFGVLALALTLLFWVGVGWFVFSRFGDGGGDPSLDSTSVASITGLQGVQWAEGAHEYQLEAPLEAHNSLQLTSGYLEITFEHGAVVLLEAPVEFTVDTRGAGTLEQGRLVARIETQAERPEIVPFAVSTPLAQIIDRGTRFGVSAAEDGTTEVSVFQGRVEATPRAQTDAHRLEPLTLIQGQSARITPAADRFVRYEGTSQFFTQVLPSQESHVLTPVSVASNGITFNAPELLIDGSGLRAEGLPAEWTHEGDTERNCWKSMLDDETPRMLTFHLGGEFDLTALWIWNYANAAPNYWVRAARRIRIEVSNDGENYTSLGETELQRFEGDVSQAQRLALNSRARYVRIVVMESYQGGDRTEVGLGEVRFEGTPVAAENP